MGLLSIREGKKHCNEKVVRLQKMFEKMAKLKERERGNFLRMNNNRNKNSMKFA